MIHTFNFNELPRSAIENIATRGKNDSGKSL